MSAWIQTFTGKKFDFEDPQPDMICIKDIAHSLSMTRRFTGHARKGYTVAQHSCLVHQIVRDWGFDDRRDYLTQALMHDAAEAYVGDMSTPLKHLIPEFKVIENRIWKVIADRFNLDFQLYETVKRADIMALQIERSMFMGKSPEPWHESVERVKPDRKIRCMKRRTAREHFLCHAEVLGIE